MDEDLANLVENSEIKGKERQESEKEGEENEKILRLGREMEEAGKKIVAKHFAVLRGMDKCGMELGDLAYCILIFFGQGVPRGFFWEPVSKLFANPGPLLQRVRLSKEIVKNRQVNDLIIRDIVKKLKNIDKNEVDSHKHNKEIQAFILFFEKFVEFFATFWPGCLVEPEIPKKKFKIPMSKKSVEETELSKKINQEKRLLQELKYQERKLKWEEERNIKKEIKEEQLRDLQREINYSKSIEDEYKKKQKSEKKK